MIVRMLMVIVLVNVARFTVCMIVFGCHAVDDDIDLGASETAATHGARVEARTNIERRGRLFKQGKGDARIDERAKQHVAADTGEAF